jgi:hypothetical protein
MCREDRSYRFRCICSKAIESMTSRRVQIAFLPIKLGTTADTGYDFNTSQTIPGYGLNMTRSTDSRKCFHHRFVSPSVEDQWTSTRKKDRQSKIESPIGFSLWELSCSGRSSRISKSYPSAEKAYRANPDHVNRHHDCGRYWRNWSRLKIRRSPKHFAQD